jgi:hypothetical protein
MVKGVGAICPLCLATHLCHFALLGTLYAARPTPGVAIAGVDAEHPQPRLLATTLALIVALGSAALAFGSALTLRAERDALSQTHEELLQRGGLLELEYFSDTRFTSDEAGARRFDAVLRDDDPVIEPSPGAHMTLVWFSDAECDSCAEFSHYLSEVILPVFNGHLKVVYKHFPMSGMHEYAADAARALEAARKQGHFWDLQRALIDRHAQLGMLDWRALATELGLDVTRFEIDRASPETHARVEDDVRRGRSIFVDGTPTIFLDGRIVSIATRARTAFWQLRADALRRHRESNDQTW